MLCPRCGSNNVNVQYVQESAKTKTRGTGCLRQLVRLILIICTCGLWLLVGKKKSTSRTAFNNEKRALCQNCGFSWPC